jgi:hypothetical protein
MALLGYYCPAGTSRLNSTIACSNAATYCPEGSAVPAPTTVGFYSLLSSLSLYVAQAQCPPGFYCVGGVQMPCPPGRYGSLPGESRATCVGTCTQGYYCPGGSTGPMQEQCGSPAVICPAVSARVHRTIPRGPL